MAMLRRLPQSLVILTLVSLPSFARGVEVVTTVDRDKAHVGDPIHVTVTVRQALTRPSIHPPSIPHCTLEQVGQMKVGMAAPQPPAVKGRGAIRTPPAANKQLTDAIAQLERQTQEMLKDHARSGGDLGLSFTREYQDLLRSYREQALEALNGPGGMDYQVTYRLTANRGGILTVPGFLVQAGGKSYQGKPLELTIEEGAPQVAAPNNPPPPSPQRPGAAPPAETPIVRAEASLFDDWRDRAKDSFTLANWPVLLILLCAPPLAYLAYAAFRQSRLRQVASMHPTNSQGAVATPRLRVNPGASPDEVATAFTCCLQARFALPRGEITPFEAAEGLVQAGVDPGFARKCAELLEACATSRFAPGERLGAADDLGARAAALIADLDQSSPRRAMAATAC